VDHPYGHLAARDPVLAKLTGEYGHPDPFTWFDGGRTGSSRFAAMTPDPRTTYGRGGRAGEPDDERAVTDDVP
jgi:hypothetical protein